MAKIIYLLFWHFFCVHQISVDMRKELFNLQFRFDFSSSFYIQTEIFNFIPDISFVVNRNFLLHIKNSLLTRELLIIKIMYVKFNIKLFHCLQLKHLCKHMWFETNFNSIIVIKVNQSNY